MTLQYFTGQVRGLRGPGLTSQQEADIAAALQPATPAQPGRMTAADKIKLNGLDENLSEKADRETVSSLNADVENIAADLDGKAPLVTPLQTQGRPGDVISRFASVLSGDAASAPLPGGAIVITDEAASVLRVVGATITGTRERVFLDPARKYRVRLISRRTADPTDPAGDTVQYGIQWLNKNKALLTPRVIDNVTQMIASGRVERTAVIAAQPGDQVDYAWPATARYMVPFIRTYGLDGESAIEIIEWEDVTDLIDTGAAIASATSVLEAITANAPEGRASFRDISDLIDNGAQALEGVSDAVDGLTQSTEDRFIQEATTRELQLGSSGPGLGLVPGSTERVLFATLDKTDGRPTQIIGDGSVTGAPTLLVQTPKGLSTVAPDSSAIVSAPGIGLIPGSLERVASATLDLDGRPIQLIGDGSGTSEGTPALLVQTAAGMAPVAPRPSLGMTGPSLGFMPGTNETVLFATLDVADGRPTQVIGDGTETGLPTLLVQTRYGLRQIGAASAPQFDPVTLDFGGPNINVPAGSIMIGATEVTWEAATLVSPATATEVMTEIAVPAIAPDGTSRTWLPHEEILSVQRVRNVSNGAERAEGNGWTIEPSRGVVTNVSGQALTIDYTGSKQRKDLVSIDPRLPERVPVLTLGTERRRTAQIWAPDKPAGHIEIARSTRKGTHAYLIPGWKWRNGVHIDRQAEDAAQLAYNRDILAPIRARAMRALPTTIVFDGNSRLAQGMGGNVANLNTRPNSHQDSDNSQSWERDVPDFYERWDAATRARAGMAPADLLLFDAVPGFNLGSGTPDGLGKVHSQQGFGWEWLKALHRKYPDWPLRVLNSSVAGSVSGNILDANGLASALHPTRHAAVIAAIETAVEVDGGPAIYVPIDPMNELGSTESYANWVQLARDAQAAGAVVHFMGNGRPDPRTPDTSIAAWEFSSREMVRAAWDTGSAVSDASRLLAPANLCGLGLIDDEIASANGRNHDGPEINHPVGLDVARNY